MSEWKPLIMPQLGFDRDPFAWPAEDRTDEEIAREKMLEEAEAIDRRAASLFQRLRSDMTLTERRVWYAIEFGEVAVRVETTSCDSLDRVLRELHPIGTHRAMEMDDQIFAVSRDDFKFMVWAIRSQGYVTAVVGDPIVKSET